MKITRIYTGADSESYFGELDLPLKDAGDIGALSQVCAVEGIIFRRTEGDYDFSWHNAPARQFVIMLDGRVDIEVGSGEVRRFGPGDVLLAEDVHGRGHLSRAVDGEVRHSIFVTLAEGAEVIYGAGA